MVLLMQGGPRDDSCRLRISFGVQAKEAILTHRARLPGEQTLRIRLVLEDQTAYPGVQPEHRLHLELEGALHRRKDAE